MMKRRRENRSTNEKANSDKNIIGRKTHAGL
jgi:hypothetical protein